jgi:hypothetical protein
MKTLHFCQFHSLNYAIKTTNMRAFQRLLATTSSSPGRSVPLSLLPPIPLYRRVLRAQRRLPGDMRVLGDEYIKSEFRAHRNIENPLHIVSFTLALQHPKAYHRVYIDWLSHSMAAVCSKD